MSQTKSPVPGRVIVMGEMDFSEAIGKVIDGQKISRVEWADRECYGFMNQEVLSLHKDGKNYQWIISDGDLQGKDWIVI